MTKAIAPRLVIKRDGIAQTDGFPREELLGRMHKLTSMSMDWAMKHEGYTVHEEIFVITAERHDGEPFELITKLTERAAKLACTKLTKDLGTLYKATEWVRTTGPALSIEEI